MVYLVWYPWRLCIQYLSLLDRFLKFENPREKSRDARITLKIGPNGAYLDFFRADFQISKFWLCTSTTNVFMWWEMGPGMPARRFEGGVGIRWRFIFRIWNGNICPLRTRYRYVTDIFRHHRLCVSEGHAPIPNPLVTVRPQPICGWEIPCWL